MSCACRVTGGRAELLYERTPLSPLPVREFALAAGLGRQRVQLHEPIPPPHGGVIALVDSSQSPCRAPGQDGAPNYFGVTVSATPARVGLAFDEVVEDPAYLRLDCPRQLAPRRASLLLLIASGCCRRDAVGEVAPGGDRSPCTPLRPFRRELPRRAESVLPAGHRTRPQRELHTPVRVRRHHHLLAVVDVPELRLDAHVLDRGREGGVDDEVV